MSKTVILLSLSALSMFIGDIRPFPNHRNNLTPSGSSSALMGSIHDYELAKKNVAAKNTIEPFQALRENNGENFLQLNATPAANTSAADETNSLQYTYPLKTINLRAEPSVNSKILMQVQAFERLELLNTAKKETLTSINVTDYWYQVLAYKEDGTELKGYVFGHYLSVRLLGRKSVTLRYTQLEIGDQWHYLFTDVQTNVEKEYDVSDLRDFSILGDEAGINKALKNQLFNVTINTVPGKVYQGEEYFDIQDKTIIVNLKLQKSK